MSRLAGLVALRWCQLQTVKKLLRGGLDLIKNFLSMQVENKLV